MDRRLSDDGRYGLRLRVGRGAPRPIRGAFLIEVLHHADSDVGGRGRATAMGFFDGLEQICRAVFLDR
jgi:hypothetical protein